MNDLDDLETNEITERLVNDPAIACFADWIGISRFFTQGDRGFTPMKLGNYGPSSQVIL